MRASIVAHGFSLLIASLTAFSQDVQEQTPFTRLFDTGVASAQPLANEAIAKRVGWTLVPEDKVDHPFSGDAVLLNDKLAVVLRKQGRGAEVYSKAAGGLKHRATLGHLGASSPVTDSLEALKIIENTSSAVMVEASFRSAGSAAVRFRLTTGEAILEIRPDQGAKSVEVLTKSRYVVVPDYFGDDVVFDAPSPRPSPPVGERVPEGRVRGNVYLPAENFCLNLLNGGDAIMMMVWQSSEQDVWLGGEAGSREQGAGRGGCSSRIRCLKGKSIWLAFLESPGLWHAGSASAKEDWKPPFPAKWRCSSLRVNGVADSWDWERGPVRDSRRVTPSLAPDGGEGARRTGEGDSGGLRESVRDGERVPAGPFLVYPIDRSIATPLTATCPTDVMRNTLGVGPCQYILACEGLGAQGDPTPNSVMNWVEKQFETKKERRSADEIKERLQVMTEHVAQARARIQSYGEFAGRMRKFLANKPGSEPFRQIVDGLDGAVGLGLMQVASPDRAKGLAGEVAALIGKPDALAPCRNLGGDLRFIGAVQDSALAKCRMAVRRLRAESKTVVASQPSEFGLAEEVQKLAEQMLQGKSGSSSRVGDEKR